MIFQIPTDSTVTDFKQTAQLDGSTYELQIDYSEGSDSWFLSVYLQTDGDPVPVVEGIRMSCGYPLLMGVTTPGRPLGDLFLMDLNGGGEAGRLDLGKRTKLYYFDSEELGG